METHFRNETLGQNIENQSIYFKKQTMFLNLILSSYKIIYSDSFASTKMVIRALVTGFILFL